MAKKMTQQEFIERAKEIHGDKYDYSKVEYKNSSTKVCIICPEHGEFWQVPNSHLNGNGCRKCKYDEYKEKRSKTFEEFVNQAKEVHGDKYDYSKVEYKNNHTKVCIICPEHGEFWQTPKNHLNSQGCMKCKLKEQGKRLKYTTEKFIEKAKQVHGDIYDYSKVNYVDSKTKVCIICHKHGEFWQTPNNHLHGHGCKKCFESHMERDVAKVLNENNIKFEQEKTFDWLKYENNLYLDFYLPEYDVAIECQGEQHFQPVDFSGKNYELAKKQFLLIQNRDKIKKTLCEKNGIKLLYYISNEDYNTIIKKIRDS